VTDRTPEPLTPEIIEGMDSTGIDALLGQLDPRISLEPTLLHLAPRDTRRLAAIGDTHGDWRSTKAALAWFLEAPDERAFVGLGDYVDRAPADCPAGSAVNALYLLSVKAAHPERVVLIRGNHEAARRIPVVPHDLPREMDEKWGPDRHRYSRLMGLLERGPLAAYTSSGVYLAHGGFPSRLLSPWTDRFSGGDETLFVELLWRRIAATHVPGLLPRSAKRNSRRSSGPPASTCSSGATIRAWPASRCTTIPASRCIRPGRTSAMVGF